MTNKINKLHGVLIEDAELTERVEKLIKQTSDVFDDFYEITDTHEEKFDKVNDTLNTLAEEITSVKGGVTKQIMSVLPVIDLTNNDDGSYIYNDYKTTTIDGALYLAATSPKQETQLSEDEISTLAESLVSFPCILRPSANVKMMSANLYGTTINFNTPSNMTGNFTIDTKYTKYEEQKITYTYTYTLSQHGETEATGYIYKFYFPYTEATEPA